MNLPPSWWVIVWEERWGKGAKSMDELRVVQDLVGSVSHVPMAGPQSQPYWLARRAGVIRVNALHSGAVRLERPRRRPRRGLPGKAKGGTVRAISRD